jgi:LysR family transcriptional regulator, nitrogen assimilation regulatory protein
VNVTREPYNVHMKSILNPSWPVLVLVAELGSVTRAAAALNCAQSVISRQIAQLEQQCGCRLLRRTGRGVALTDFGEQWLPRIKALITQAKTLEDDIRTSSGEPIGEVRVGLLPSSVEMFAGELLRRVRERYPRVRLHVTDGASAQLEERLTQGRLDLSLLLRDDDRERPGEIALTQQPLHLLGPAGDSLTTLPSVPFIKLDGLPLVLPSDPHVLRGRLEIVARTLGVRLHVAVEADSISLQREAVAAGMGYAIVVVTHHQKDTRFSFAPLSEPTLLRRIVLGIAPLRPYTLAMRRVAELLTELGRRAE